MADEKNGNPFADSPESESNIPDWMKEAGWENDSGTFDESKPVFEDLEGEDEIVPADIPAWLEEAAPEGYDFDPQSPDKPEEKIAAEPGESFVGDDLKLDPDLEQAAEKPIQQDRPARPRQEPPQEELDVPTWLKNLELDEDSQETAIAWLENMPESLRATEEELEQSRQPKDDQPEEDAGSILSWMDELASEDEIDQDQAELSEDLVAADLIPEQQADDKLFVTEELRTFQDTSPDWLDELDPAAGQTAGGEPGTTTESPLKPEKEPVNLMPDWLAELNELEKPIESEPASEAAEVTSPPTDSEQDLPSWLGDVEEKEIKAEAAEESPSLDWLDSLADTRAESAEQPQAASEGPEYLAEESELTLDREPVSPDDDTLNTQIPDWLSQLGEQESVQQESESDLEFETAGTGDSSAWLEELQEQPTGELKQEDPARDSEVMEWLEGRTADQEEEADLGEDFRETYEEPTEQVVLETAKYLPEEQPGDDIPDWLAELESPDQEDISLEQALKQSGHALSEEEQDYLDQMEVTKDENADWLAKLDQDQVRTDQEASEPAPSAEALAEDIELPEEETPPDRISVTGGILDRLKDTGAFTDEPEVPQWLENLKKEEDPQETAILWLKQFVEKGNQANLQAEIKRYTDELHPGNVIPKWMEDLKNEEDPQTTAMLWLEKLSGDRAAAPKAHPGQAEADDSDWLTALEKEEAEQSKSAVEQPSGDFLDDTNGWLAELEIDEKTQAEAEDLPDWMEESAEDAESKPEGETPEWMKATSPLEGDFHTDELAGTEKEVEIPDWLAGYGEGEPEAAAEIDQRLAGSEPTVPTDLGEQDEYTWVPTKDTPKPAKSPIDLNTAAISQLENILGISYQVARGIVRYREQHGPFQDLSDLLNVPEITDEQTIEILKPEVIIKEVKAPPKPAKAAETKPALDADSRLAAARSDLAGKDLPKALKEYTYLIKKKKLLSEVIADLNQAVHDHPLNIALFKTLGDAYMKSDNLEAALEAYSKAEDLL